MNKSGILDLILLKQEGSYWDFKREWYFQDKKADLLHDIICMANNLSNRDAYIIVGVDEENDYSFSSVKSKLFCCNFVKSSTCSIGEIFREASIQ